MLPLQALKISIASFLFPFKAMSQALTTYCTLLFGGKQINALKTLDQAKLLPLPKRAHVAHKGDFGHVLVIGGDLGMGGAALLAGLFAARTGAGKVTVATRLEHVNAIISKEPCLMAKGIQTENDLISLLNLATTLVVGPGLGRSSWSESLFMQAINSPCPKVFDADALFWLKDKNLRLDAKSIFTPHPGEAAMLLDIDVTQVQENRLQAVLDLQQRYGGIAILKGAGTLITDGSHLYRCDPGNPGMASGGMGDALSGILGGLLAQGLTPIVAAQTGVLAHALAGDTAAKTYGEIGLLATDLINPLRQVLNGLIL